MITLHTQLDNEDINEDEQVYTVGDSILMSFYYGNYSDGIKELLEYQIRPEELAEYLEDKAEEYNTTVSELYNGHFTLSLFSSIGSSFEQGR